MATGTVKTFAVFGGVDVRSNPLAMPPNRSLRCLNWIRTEARYLKLRFGYTQAAMSAVDASAIHSAVEFERYNATKYLIFGQGTALKRMDVGSVGTVTQLATLTSGANWDTFFAANRLFISNGPDFKNYDGTTLRNTGIRAPSAAEVASITVAESTAATGSWSTTSFSGYQFYMAYYNSATGHVGNRTAIGSRRTVAGTQSVIVLSSLPNLSGVDGEWVKVIGRTGDGAEVPYVLIDTSGNWITAGNTATGLTISKPDLDYNYELPTRNAVPPAMSKLAYANGRAYGISDSDPHHIYYSEAEYDAVQGAYMGRPEESWPSNNRLPFPTGERALAIHEQDNECWVWSRNHLVPYTEAASYAPDGIPTPWAKGIFVGGCAGQRAFSKTPYGPAWLSPEREVLTFREGGPVPFSEEYQAALLKQIADAQIVNAELGYHRAPGQAIDRLYVKGVNAAGGPVIVIHDFKLRSDQSPYGEGSEYTYAGMTVNVLVRQPQSIFSFLDSNGVARLWTGATNGRFYQLEDGDSDNGSTYSADYITLLNFGDREPLLAGIEFNGDSKVAIRTSHLLNLTPTQFEALESAEVQDVTTENAQYRAAVEQGAQFMLMRVQLDSHHADGSLTLNDPPHMPLETYGVLYVARPEFGTGGI